MLSAHHAFRFALAFCPKEGQGLHDVGNQHSSNERKSSLRAWLHCLSTTCCLVSKAALMACSAQQRNGVYKLCLLFGFAGPVTCRGNKFMHCVVGALASPDSCHCCTLLLVFAAPILAPSGWPLATLAATSFSRWLDPKGRASPESNDLSMSTSSPNWTLKRLMAFESQLQIDWAPGP